MVEQEKCENFHVKIKLKNKTCMVAVYTGETTNNVPEQRDAFLDVAASFSLERIGFFFNGNCLQTITTVSQHNRKP